MKTLLEILQSGYSIQVSNEAERIEMKNIIRNEEISENDMLQYDLTPSFNSPIYLDYTGSICWMPEDMHTQPILKWEETKKMMSEFTGEDLKLFDIVEHENGAKQMVVSINEEKEFSRLDGDGNSFGCVGENPIEGIWQAGKIQKVWRAKGRGSFGVFLKFGFREVDFNLVWERRRPNDDEIKKLEEEQKKLQEQMNAVSKAIADLSKCGNTASL